MEQQIQALDRQIYIEEIKLQLARINNPQRHVKDLRYEDILVQCFYSHYLPARVYKINGGRNKILITLGSKP